jgi:hypothetical protein
MSIKGVTFFNTYFCKNCVLNIVSHRQMSTPIPKPGVRQFAASQTDHEQRKKNACPRQRFVFLKKT